MSMPLSFVVYDPGIGGIPTTTNPRNLAARITSLDTATCNEFGMESCRITLENVTIEEAENWAHRLMSSCEVTTRSGKRRFEGFLHDVAIKRGGKTRSRSMTNVANKVTASYTTSTETKGTVTVSNAASIACYGTKELVLSVSSVTLDMATSFANMVLAQRAFPPNLEPSTLGEKGGGAITLDLTFRGWAETLKWLSTGYATDSLVPTIQHVAAQLATYNDTNNFFSLSQLEMTSTGRDVTSFIEPGTTFMQAISKVLAAGDSSNHRLFWGIFAGRQMTIRPVAAVTPETITYYEHERTGEIRQAVNGAMGSIVPPEDYEPDVMVQTTDWNEPPPPASAIASLTRKYIKRATLTISKGVVKGTLEPDDPSKLIELLARPVSAVPTDRQAQLIHTLTPPLRTVFAPTDNPNRYNPVTGVWKPPAGGTGIPNVGTITVPHDVNLGDGTGVGGVGETAVTGSGTPPKLARWVGTHKLTDAIPGSDYIPPPTLSGAAGWLAEWETDTTLHAATIKKQGAGAVNLTSDDTLTVFLSGGSTNDVLTFDGTNWAPQTFSAGDIGGVTGSGTPGRITQWDSTGVAIEDSHLHTLGAGIIALSADADYTATIALTGTVVMGSGTTGKFAYWTGVNTIGAGALDATTLIDGSGTAGRVTQWFDADTLTDATLIKSGAGLLTLSSASAFTLTVSGSINISGTSAVTNDVLRYNGTAFIPAALTMLDGSGTAGRVAQWVDADTLTSASLVKADTGLLTLSAHSAQTITFEDGADGGTLALWDLGSGVLLEVFGRISITGDGAGGNININNASALTIDHDIEIEPNGATDKQVLTYINASSDWRPRSVSALFGSGTAGRVTQWAAGGVTIEDSTLIMDGGGILTLSAGGDYTLTVPATGTAALGTGSTDALAKWSDANTLTTATLGSDYTRGSGTVGQLVKWDSDGVSLVDGPAGTPGYLAKWDTDGKGLIDGPSGTVGRLIKWHTDGFSLVDGASGTANRIMQWGSDGQTPSDSTLAKSGAGVLTLSAGSAYTATIAITGTVAMGTGTINKLTYWTGTNTIGASSITASELVTQTTNGFNFSIPFQNGGNLDYRAGFGFDALSSERLATPGGYEVAGVQVVGAQNTGWSAWTGTGSKASKDTTTATTADNAAAIKAIIDALLSHGLLG